MRRIPTATYRLQFREGMTFERAAALAPYWQRLGISHLYASPIFTATDGSTHGYDVTDHGALDPALGGREGFEAMSAALREHDLGLILDIVPNHMAASLENPWYRDVLRHGEASRYARHFDIDWAAPKLLVTTLGAPYGDVLEAGEFGLALLPDGPAFTIYDKSIPLDPTTWEHVFDAAPDDLSTLPSAPHAEARTEWFVRLDKAQRAALQRHLERLSGDREALHAIHEAQPWRLTYWRAARDTLTHRRFFEITDLIGVRVEDEAVFDDVHALTFDLVGAGHVHGVRIDHVDGLADPSGYLAQLEEKMPPLASGEPAPVWVEKILGPHEHMPDSWPVEGTTGYEAATFIAGAMVDPAGREPLTASYDDFTGHTHDFDAMLAEAKREIITRNLAAELRLLTQQAQAIAATDRTARDYGFDTLRRAVVALACAMPVYRTYLKGRAGPRDRAILNGIEERAVATIDVEDAGAVGFVADLLRDRVEKDETRPEEHERLRRRFQQTTGALMAKALEDTLFYRYHRLVALNEVGAEPDVFGLSDAAFHGAVAERAAHQPDGLVTTATHDTKRGEDARMRQAAIASHPALWVECVARWDAELCEKCENPPEADMRWLFYQALLGAWEGTQAHLRERLATFLVKAAREAKGETSWVRTDEDYEARLGAFVSAALPDGDTAFLDAFIRDAAPVIATGERLSMAQTALHLTLPGVPDVYQGTEDGDFSLVDPDNRRPPDFEALAQMLGLETVEADAFGATKFALVHRLLTLRTETPDLFERGDYTPVTVEGEGRLPIAYIREHEGERLLVVAGRAPEPVQASVRVEGEWRHPVTGETFTGPITFDGSSGPFPVMVLRG